jgi:diguanylate cyclase (GGDEF)-like protein
LVHLATHDALTGLLNRAAFISDVENALHYATIEPTLTAVLFVDLDRFKEVNDRLGHQAGDTLLAVACRRIVASLRPTELAGRLGGDEVGVLCPDLPSRESAVRLAERILMALEEPFTVHDEVVLIGASIGLAFSGPEPLTATALVHLADLAMYRAKEQGRARCVVHTEGDQPKRPTPRTGELTSSIAHVAVSVTRDEREVNDLWRHSIDLRDDPLSQRLARIGQLLHAANAALRDDSAIG